MEKRLTQKQKAFADYYIETGNATEAAKKAGYSEKYLNTHASKMLRNATISAYIAERVRPTEEKRIATGDEVMTFYTKVMRGEIKDAFDLPPSLQDRLNAAKELAKRTIDIDRKNNTGSDVVANMKTLAEVLLESRPNRNLEDFE